MEYIITKLIDFIDKFYHQKKINKFLINFNLKYVIDIGSHKGEFIDSIIDINNKLKIYAVEPQSKIFKKLQNKYKNTKKINLFKCAISNKNGKKNLKINIKSSTSSFSNYNKDSKWRKLKEFLLNGFGKSSFINLEKVNTITLDKFCKKNKISKIDLLKIDTEGHEREVLEGGKKVLKNKTEYVLIEFHLSKIYQNYNFQKIDKILKNKKFKLIKKFKFPFLAFEDRIYKKIN